QNFQNVLYFDLVLQYKSERSDDLILPRTFKTSLVRLASKTATTKNQKSKPQKKNQTPEKARFQLLTVHF
ncbi:TPA: hypothetical protein ACGXH3_002571, partial [Listeria monocytogenes]